MKKKVFISFLAVFWINLLFVVMISSIDGNVMLLGRDARDVQITLLPQGWAFFTKNPRELEINLYKVIGKRIKKEDFINGNNRDYLGLRRNNRAKGMELSLIQQAIRNATFIECEDGVLNCEKISSLKEMVVKNTSRLKTYCGDYYLAFKERTPWAWAQVREFSMPEKATKIVIECEV